MAQVAPADVFYVVGSTRKIEQLVGDYDNHLKRSTRNLTNSKYRLWGTDLGVPFWHNGKTYMLFGDVPGTDRDPIAYTTDTLPDDGMSLTFTIDSTGTYRPLNIPGVSQGEFEVPMEGVSVGGSMYVYHTTDRMTKTILAKSMDNGLSFKLVDTFSGKHFINVSIAEVNLASWPGFAHTHGSGLVVFGSGDYRSSSVRLAYQPSDSVECMQSIRYFSGYDSLKKKPIWSPNEVDAIAMFNQPCVGEFSVTYNIFIKKWIMLYNCNNPRGILFRTADQPWGPWSISQSLFEPWIDKGYCHFIHVNWNYSNCDSVHDPGREFAWGGEYGPYQFEKFATGNDTSTTIYYTMSTWNPYTVVLMKSQLVKSSLVAGISNASRQRMKTICYPNPTDDVLTVEYNDNNDHKSIIIYNSTGVAIQQFRTAANRLTLNTSQWNAGIYFIVTVSDQGRISTDEVIIK